VSRTSEAAAARFRNGELSAFDKLTRLVSDDLASYHHEIERGQAMRRWSCRARVVLPFG